MMMQVQPRRRRLSSIAFSVIGSSAAVASSRTRSDGFGDQSAGDLDPLALSAAEVRAALADQAVVVPGSRRDVVVNARVLQRLRYLRLADRRIPQREVVANRALEQEDVLVDIGDRVGEQLRRDLRQWPAVEADFARPRACTGRRSAGRASTFRCPKRRPAPPACPARPQIEVRRSAAAPAANNRTACCRARSARRASAAGGRPPAPQVGAGSSG